MISIPSEQCPVCRVKGGHCSMMILPLDTLRVWSVKNDESQFRKEMEGRNGPYYREAYLVQEYVCLKGKGSL